jgi:hypothetical protein
MKQIACQHIQNQICDLYWTYVTTTNTYTTTKRVSQWHPYLAKVLRAHQLRGLAGWGAWHLHSHHCAVLAALLVQVSYDLSV